MKSEMTIRKGVKPPTIVLPPTAYRQEREKELLVARRLPTTSAPEPQGQPCPQASSSDSGGENSTLPPPKRPR